MKDQYIRVILYAYPSIEKEVEARETRVRNKVLGYKDDLRKCTELCDELVGIMNSNHDIINLKNCIDSVLLNFTEDELIYFKHKYFLPGPSDRFDKMDPEFRKKVSELTTRFNRYFTKKGFNNEWFETDGMQVSILSRYWVAFCEWKYQTEQRIKAAKRRKAE